MRSLSAAISCSSSRISAEAGALVERGDDLDRLREALEIGLELGLEVGVQHGDVLAVD